jgi:hypothetical protein
MAKLILRLVVYALIIFAFYLGLPQFHYGIALMVAVLIKCKDNPAKLLQNVDSLELHLPKFTRLPKLTLASISFVRGNA